MLANTDPRLLERFRATIAARMGLSFDDNRQGDLRTILDARARACRLSSPAYLDHLAESPAELPELARHLTVPETYFFRNQDQLDACMECVVPAAMTRRSEPGLRILSAACASGEEPYTLAILLRERWPAYAPSASILAVDINPSVLQRARLARYSAWSLRETTPELKARYFRSSGTDFVLESSIRAAVQFKALNLAAPDPGQLPEASFDIVFCRNVLMYFTPEQFARTVTRLARALVPGGCLFLGHAETLRGISQDFHLHYTGKAFYYQRKQGALRTSIPPAHCRQHVPPRSSGGMSSAASEPACSRQVTDVSAYEAQWFDAIARSNDRVHALRPHEPAVSLHVASDFAGRERKHERLLELLQKEKFAPALALLESAPADESDVDDALMQAVLSAHAGNFADARKRCGLILEGNELNTGAQYVLALCHEHDGDTTRAIYHYQLSAYLDPDFAMPRLHLGLLFRRLQATEAAERELREARRLLVREDVLRLALFGGGFGRTALLELCDAELAPRSRAAR